MASLPSMRVAMPTASSSGGNAPFSGSRHGVSGIECVSPSPKAGAELAPVAYKETPNWMDLR